MFAGLTPIARALRFFVAQLLLVLVCATSADASPLVLKNPLPDSVKDLPATGRLERTKVLHLAIGLPLRDAQGLQQLVQEIYNPNSPEYRRYRTPEQLADSFAPTAEQFQGVVTWAKSHGLTPSAEHPNRLVIEVDAPVSAIEAAMHVHLVTHQHPTEPRVFFAPDADPSLDVPFPMITIDGLSDFYVPQPHHKIRPLPEGTATPKSGSGPSGTYAGNDFRAAYAPGVSLTGTGQSVALVEFDGYYTSDITSYESQFGLPSVTLSNIAINGGVNVVGSGNSEVALDIEMAIAMAPGLAKVYVYEAPNSLANFTPMLSKMQTDNFAHQIGCSWGGGSENPSAENVFLLMAAQGQSFYNATGDSDAFVGAIPFPSDSTNIIQVGATTLSTTGPSGSYVSETVWNWGRVNGSYTGSSGGISTVFGIPPWQTGISMTANQGSTTFRNVPDVALTGDAIYVRYNNGSAGSFGGTSCAAPLWAGLTALINQRAASQGQSPVGFINPAIYAIGKGANYANSFHDVTTGNNFSRSSPSKFAAVTGYDLCAGWGTPSASGLMAALVPSVGVAARLTIQTQPSSTATAGVPFAVQPVIRIEDSVGTLVTNDNSTIVTATRLSGLGTLLGTTSMTAVNGLVTFTNLSHRYANTITISFTSGSLASATSTTVAVAPAAFSQLQVLLPGQTATPTVSPGRTGTPTSHVSGTAFNVTVNAVDAFWNFVNTASDTVGLTSSDSIAILPANASLASGTRAFSVTLKTVGTQTISASDISQPAITNDSSAGVSITPATLTVVASNASRVYGQTNPVFGGTLTGVQSGDNITATFNSSATTNSAKGTYTIVPTLVDPNNRLGNYTVLSTNGTLTITAAPLSVTASNASRQYGQTNPVFGGSISGLQNNDNITVTFTSSATTNSAVGNYAITPILSDPSSKLSNYTVTTNNGTLTISTAPLSVIASNASRQYGQTNPVFTGTLTGLLNNDNITATFSSSATTNSPIGNYPITPTFSDPTTKLSNYAVTTNAGALTISTASLTVTADDAARVWGAPNPTFTGTITGIRNNDNITANYSTTATTNSAVGTYPITFTLSDPGVKLPNYSVSTNNGTLTVSNNAPSITQIADQFASVGSTLSLTVSASDPDQPWQTLSFSLDPGAPSGAIIDSNSGAFTWAPGVSAQGTTNPITVRVADNAIPSQSSTMSFNVIVIDHPTLADMHNNPDGSVTLTWNVVAGANYVLQFKNALTDATWTNLAPFTPSSSPASVSDNPGGLQRFYRIAAGSSFSDPAGVIPLPLLGNSDSYISIPFTRPVAASGAVSSVSGNVIGVASATWSAGQFVYSAGVQSNSYYARFESGNLEGRIFNIVTNDGTTLTVDLGTDTLDAVTAGDLVSVVPHWTLASAFPNGDGVLTSPSPGNRPTEILFPDNSTTGINLSATKIYYFNGGTWKQVGQGSVNHGDDVLVPASYFIVRQNSVTNSTFNTLGAVVVTKLATGLRTSATSAQDNALGLQRAHAVTLDNSGLISSGAFLPSSLPGTRTDELLTFDNSVAQKNKSSSSVYYYWNSGWRRVGSGSTNFGTNEVFVPGTGFIIRKATNNSAPIWTNAP